MLTVNTRDKSLLIDPLYHIGIGFWLLVLVLLGIIGWGGYMYYQQITVGLGQTGLNRPVFWGVYMVNFIFLIGVSMAGTLISAALQLTGANWRRPITRIAETLTVFGLLVAALQILFDMGRPERMISIFIYGRLQSPLLWDATSLTLYILASMGALFMQLLPDIALLRDNVPANAPKWRSFLYRALALGWRGNREQWRRLEKVITTTSILIIPIGVSLHTVTSWIFSTTVQPGWKSTILGPYFVVGAVFSGIGMLLIVVTIFRQRMGLQEYIQEQQYRSLKALFIVMSIIWFYFTYTEHLTIVAGQEVMEFPVLASKLWGTFAPTFWGMVGLMVVATWVLIVPNLLPSFLQELSPLFSGQWLLGQGITAVFLSLVLFMPEQLPFTLSLAPDIRTLLWVIEVMLLLALVIGFTLWCRRHLIRSMIIASVCVVVGMWLERWNIIIPTVTHPRLVPYATYLPSPTELSVTAASFAMLVLGPLLFFKLFPAISIWEVAEGRVIAAAEAQIEIPAPEPVGPKRKRPFEFRRPN
ncbi:MAG: polysulfide reductase NrfD [Anaerolineales bacterium]|nr:polysulfide reductase NrfD [Anaerolineales bacterium]